MSVSGVSGTFTSQSTPSLWYSSVRFNGKLLIWLFCPNWCLLLVIMTCVFSNSYVFGFFFFFFFKYRPSTEEGDVIHSSFALSVCPGSRVCYHRAERSKGKEKWQEFWLRKETANPMLQASHQPFLNSELLKIKVAWYPQVWTGG